MLKPQLLIPVLLLPLTGCDQIIERIAGSDNETNEQSAEGTASSQGDVCLKSDAQGNMTYGDCSQPKPVKQTPQSEGIDEKDMCKQINRLKDAKTEKELVRLLTGKHYVVEDKKDHIWQTDNCQFSADFDDEGNIKGKGFFCFGGDSAKGRQAYEKSQTLAEVEQLLGKGTVSITGKAYQVSFVMLERKYLDEYKMTFYTNTDGELNGHSFSGSVSCEEFQPYKTITFD